MSDGGAKTPEELVDRLVELADEDMRLFMNRGRRGALDRDPKQVTSELLAAKAEMVALLKARQSDE